MSQMHDFDPETGVGTGAVPRLMTCVIACSAFLIGLSHSGAGRYMRMTYASSVAFALAAGESSFRNRVGSSRSSALGVYQFLKMHLGYAVKGLYMPYKGKWANRAEWEGKGQENVPFKFEDRTDPFQSGIVAGYQAGLRITRARLVQLRKRWGVTNDDDDAVLCAYIMLGHALGDSAGFSAAMGRRWSGRSTGHKPVTNSKVDEYISFYGKKLATIPALAEKYSKDLEALTDGDAKEKAEDIRLDSDRIKLIYETILAMLQTVKAS